MSRWATDLLMLMLPISLFQPLGGPVVERTLPVYVTRGLFLPDIAIVLLLIAGFLLTPFKRLGPRYFFFPLLGVCALAFLSIISALDSGFAYYTAVRWLLTLIVYLWLVQAHVDAPRAVRVLIIGLCIHVLIGLMQVLLQRPLGLPGELALPASVSGAAVVPVGDLRWLRAYGLTFHPNVLGGFLAYGLIAGLPLLGRKAWAAAWWLLWLGLFLSFSRAAWIAAFGGVGIVMTWIVVRRPLLRRNVMTAAVGAAVVLFACVVLWYPQLQTRVQPLLRFLPGSEASVEPDPTPRLEARSLDERAEFLRLGLEFVKERPWTGLGAGGFPIAVVRQSIAVSPQYPHLVPLALAAEVGVVAGMLWVFLWLAGAGLLIAYRRTADLWIIALLAGWLALGVIGLADSYPWSLNAGRLLTVTALGLAGNRLASSRLADEKLHEKE